MRLLTPGITSMLLAAGRTGLVPRREGLSTVRLHRMASTDSEQPQPTSLETDGLFSREDGEHSLRALREENAELRERLSELQAIVEETDGLCEVLGDLDLGASFWPGYRARASWLVGLLMLQSASSFILAGEQDLLSAHPVVVYFLTMLVGAGGNAGNQSAVRVIRGLAVGALTEKTVKPFLLRELYMAMAITATLVLFGGARVVFFHGSGRDALVVTTSLALIVSASIIIGALLPLVMHRLRLDAAHAGTSIQVVMDILGVTVTCFVANAMFATS